MTVCPLEGFPLWGLAPEQPRPDDADEATWGRSLIPPGTGLARDFSYVGTELPELLMERCVACMECVTLCPDAALYATVQPAAALEPRVAEANVDGAVLRAHFVSARKYPGGGFGLFVDPSKCKGCGECVTACGEHKALRMAPKSARVMAEAEVADRLRRTLPPTPESFIQERLLPDMMLAERALLYVGGAGSCRGCGEASAIRMMLAATGFQYGERSAAIVAATGCNTVFSSSFPHNPFLVSWTNSLFENAAAVAMGVRARWDQIGLEAKKCWVLGGDGAMFDIGFQALSRMLMTGMDINVLVLDTQVYSNTGGQASTATYTGQNAKMAAIGPANPGKREPRKELGAILMMHGDVYVAQTTIAHVNHFYRSVIAANAFPGPSVIIVYAACPPEHGIGDDRAAAQSRLAVDCRVFPLFVYDPAKGATIAERLDLRGNPRAEEDYVADPKTGRLMDAVAWARTEGRFAKHFAPDGAPDETLGMLNRERLANWRRLRELAGRL